MQVIQLYIEGERVDMFSDESVNITQTIQNVKDISKIFTDFSKTFTLPASKTNNKIFEHYYNFDIVDGFDARTKKNSYIELNHKPFRKGKIKLEGVDLKDNKAYSYRITFFGNTVDLKDLLGEDTLSSLDWLNNFNQTYSAAAVRTGLTTGYNKTVGGVTYNKAVVAPLITHTTRLYYDSGDTGAEYPDPTGGNLYPHGSHHHGVYFEELKYAIKVHLIVKAIEESYGIQFSEDFFATDNAAYYDLYFWLHRKKGKAFDSAEVTYQVINFPLLFGEMIGVNCYPDKLLIFGQSVGITYNLVITSTTTNPYTVIIKKDGQIFAQKNVTSGSTSLQGILTNSSTGYTVFIQTNNAMTNVVADWQLESIQYPEAYNYTSDQFNITLTQEFIITEQIPDIKVIDFLTGVFKMFNLTAYEEDGIIVVRTLDSFYASSTTTWDITDYLAYDNSTVDIALPYKRIDFKYENLDTKLSKQHEQVNLNGWGTVQYDAGENFDAGGDIYSVVAPFEHMKYERLIDSTTETIKTPQVGWFVDDNNDPYYGKPLLTYAINVTGNSIRFLNAITGGTGSFNDITSYYIPSNSVALNPVTSTDNINFNLEVNEYTFTTDFINTLFNKYYNTYISEVFNSKRRITKVKAYLPINFLINYSLADKIKIGDKVYIINSINSNLLNGESSLELLNVVSPITGGGEQPNLENATVSTLAGTSTETTFTMNGQVTFEGVEPYTERGFYWVQGTGTPIGGTKVIVSGSGTSAYSATVTGKTASTTFSFIAYAINNGITTYGTPARQVTTTAALSAPSVITVSSSPSTTSATLYGNVTNVGNPPYTQKGFYYIQGTGNPLLGTQVPLGNGGAGSYSTVISGLNQTTTYSFLAYATNTQGTSYGSTLQFTTQEIFYAPIVSTVGYDSVGYYGATMYGNINDVGNPPYTSKGFYLMQGIGNPTSSNTTIPVSGTAAGAFNGAVTNLNDGTLYSFRAFGINNQGIGYGATDSFTTEAIPVITCDGGTMFYEGGAVTGVNATVSTGNVSYGTGGCNDPYSINITVSNNETGEWSSTSQITSISLFQGNSSGSYPTNVTADYTITKTLNAGVITLGVSGNFPSATDDGNKYLFFQISAFAISVYTTTITLPASNAVNHASVNVVANGDTAFPASRNDSSYNNSVLYPTGEDGDAFEYTITYTADAGYEFIGIGNVTLLGTTGAGVNQIQDSYTSSTYVIKVYGNIQASDITGSANWSGSALADPATSVTTAYRIGTSGTFFPVPAAGIDVGTGGGIIQVQVTPDGGYYVELGNTIVTASVTPTDAYSGDVTVHDVTINSFTGGEGDQTSIMRIKPRGSTTTLASVRFNYFDSI